MTEWATLEPRIFNFVVGTAIGSAKGLFGKDLTAEREVFVLFAPADREGTHIPSPAQTPAALRWTLTGLSRPLLIIAELALDLHVEALQDDLGPCTLDVSSAVGVLLDDSVFLDPQIIQD